VAVDGPGSHDPSPARVRGPPITGADATTPGTVPPAAVCGTVCPTVVATMQTHGMIVADNGFNWYVQGTPDTRWTATEVNRFQQIPARASVTVDESRPMVDPGSGRARQPGTPAGTAACG